MKLFDTGVMHLAAGVVKQAALDLTTGNGYERRNAREEILQGGLNLYLDMLGIDMTPREFIKRATERGA